MGELARVEALRGEGRNQGQIAETLVLKEQELAGLLQAAQGSALAGQPRRGPADAEPFGARLEDRSLPRPEEAPGRSCS